MAFSRNKQVKEVVDQAHPEKIVIVAGPTFGNAIKFMLFGAALGAGAIYYLTQGKGGTPSPAATGNATNGESGQQLAARASALAKRIAALAVRTKDVVQTAKETMAPAINEAVAAGKDAARATEAELAAEIKAENAKSEDETAPAQPKVAAEEA